MKAALTICLMLLCTNLYAQPDSLQNSEVKIVKADLSNIHKSVKRRFKHREQAEEVFTYYGSHGLIVGDCDDFASAAYFQLWKLGTNPIIYTYDSSVGSGKSYRHVIVCAMNYCLDSNYNGVFDERSFQNRIGKSFELVEGGTGQLNEAAMLALLEKEDQTTGVKNDDLI